MGPITGVALAALISAALSGWWYGHREEKVRGRAAAAFLRGGALFLALASPWLPGVRGPASPVRSTAVLLDASLSMSLPVSETVNESRFERAADTVRALATADRKVTGWLFGDAVGPLDPASAGIPAPGISTRATARTSHLVPAIEEARTTGADTVILVTDGELDDREAARRLALRYGLAMREIRIGEPHARPAFRGVRAPRAVSPGDTLSIEFEVVQQGTAGGSLDVSASGDGFARVRVQVAPPTTGRVARGRLRVPVPSFGDTAEWRALDLRIEAVAPPWRQAATRRVWVQVAPQPAGAVLVSMDPDWEPGYLLPVLERTAPGGARAFLRVRDGHFVSGGRLPESGIEEPAVRRAAERASLLVVQGRPADIPTWLARSMEARPALLFLARGPGGVPGAAVEIRDVLDGEWYAASPPPAGPVSAYVAAAESAELPPLLRLHGSAGSPEWVILEARRDRRGEARPIATLGSAPGRRWAVVHGEGTWRWAARGGSGLQLYRGLFAGLGNWLVQAAPPMPVLLEDAAPAEGDRLAWRIAPRVRDLVLVVRDADGAAVWDDTLPQPPRFVEGPIVTAGEATVTASGREGDRSFTFERPLSVGPPAELVPGPFGPPLDVHAPARPSPARHRARGGPPVWPFAVAALLLCAEWLWRRRVGLR